MPSLPSRLILDTEWGFPAVYFGVAVLLVVALLAIGDGRSAGDFRGEVHAAKTLLADVDGAHGEELVGIESALRSLDPDAVAKAERP